MILATAKPYIDKSRPRKDNTCSIKVKITYNRQRKYYETGLYMPASEYVKIVDAKRRSNDQNIQFQKIMSFVTKAESIIERLSVFTFGKFEELYFSKRNVHGEVSIAFENRINELIEEGRTGSVVCYQNAIKSLLKFKQNLQFADIDKNFLLKYEKWMLKEGKKKTSVGIYVRQLRAIYNLQNIDASLYPFGEKGYQIPEGSNKKKALSKEQIDDIYNYEAKEGSNLQMAKDYWIFMFQCNGMNVKDMCLLKWHDIDNNILTYNRAKTEKSKKESKQIVVSLKPESKEVIKRWSMINVNKDGYVFPHIKKDMTNERKREVIQQLTKIINKYMKRISNELDLGLEVTTYYARHSFATLLKRSGRSVEMISELLGHSSTDTTQKYLDSFVTDAIHEATEVVSFGSSNSK